MEDKKKIEYGMRERQSGRERDGEGGRRMQGREKEKTGEEKR